MTKSSVLSCGLKVSTVNPSFSELLSASMNDGFDFLVVDLEHPIRSASSNASQSSMKPFGSADSDFSSSEWGSLIVGQTQSLVDLESTDSVIRKSAEQNYEMDIAWACHLGLPTVIIHSSPSPNMSNLARHVVNSLAASNSAQFWLRVPLVNNTTVDSPGRYDSWEWWNKIRTLCGYHSRFGVALEIGADLPSSSELERWKGEPVKCIIICSSIFLTNAKGFPVLSKKHQAIVQEYLTRGAQLILDVGEEQNIYLSSDSKSGSSGESSNSSKSKGKGKDKEVVEEEPELSGTAFADIFKYLSYLFKNLPPLTQAEEFTRSYEDYLQAPLQPLMDNLEASTYECFEQDPVKYKQYQLAVYKALLDRIPDSQKDEKEAVVMVVGAGRGPLVKCSIQAAASAKRKARIFVIEKNPNAIATLLYRKKTEWNDTVTIVHTDMREWKTEERADIIVSELLGSFGDNELSPECLDGAQSFLKPDGISIPSSYSSYVAPVSSHKLYVETKLLSMHGEERKAFETPYVVLMSNVHVTSKPEKCFTFVHPNHDAKIDNSRFITLKFEMKQNVNLHGFAGYFDTVLYKDVLLSIVPDTFSEGMFSWFPIYFPFRTPVYVTAGETVEIYVWRCVSSRKVWYEWSMTGKDAIPVHNPSGRSYYIGL